MLELLAVGSVALDSVKTPFGQVSEVLGGSATYFATAASYFTKVGVVAVVGEDFPKEHLAFLKGRPIDLGGLVATKGRTFRWRGEYGYQLNEARTLETQLNVFEQFNPQLPASYKTAKVVFLANIDPELQLEVLQQTRSPELVALDTMNFWIEGKRDALMKVLGKVHIVIINDGEARQLVQEVNLVKVAREILKLGPRVLIIKRGEYGALLFTREAIFSAPAYPLETVFDPTGAGDSFAGGFMGHLARTKDFNMDNLRQAVILGSVMASYCVEAFSLERFRTLRPDEIMERYRGFKRLTHFDEMREVSDG
jgi:sugar/nucleoside kinase (ribokinase family)